MLDFKPKAYFLDMDGTYLDKPKSPEKISAENIEIAKNLNDQNIPVILSTGRTNSDFVLELANKINSPYVICQNGGLIVDNKNNILIKNQIKKDLVLKIIEILKREKLFFIFNSSSDIFGTTKRLSICRPWIKKLNSHTYDEIPQITSVTKILTFGKTPGGTRKLKDKLEKEFFNLKFHIVSRGWTIEINDMNATKGIADEYVCKLLNIDPKQTVHFGDSGNDIVTKEYLGAFIAMKNSPTNIKKQATIVGKNYKRGGIAKTIKKITNNFAKTE
ncbi:haloacid dehalogenase [Metamycoplasma equirhinis]|uniref:Cof-type HAD-IIB family hydrolase n=1 Tax=Metamycoplasma equirhinis TaxID=92402 RepID=UPI002572306D|nr:HAD family hydrolase [Metamycoplasma equirhinis]BDX52449.1 haloacid dehalogenase [Metamycoplasma equirhinis]